MEQQNIDLIMGIGPTVQFAADVSKTIRVGTIKQIKEVAAIYNSGIYRIKPAVSVAKEEESETMVSNWVEILNMICIDGFTREEFDNSIPELMESAVDRFLYGQ
ncbi:hypothetical protein BBD42_30865 [Paenibacillus sp. BIHB 4019]|uniref:Uncharacterized protein n=1 Tax=Paenibacillus sp. BIHB 4019 TaxID=1870819 RepID=A0A1B2DRS0_9BACL|nr:hypothetical protein [Paenibacillus sp. BIHB 4019]ANY70409.1 hypothetical protein BBD42_30865 [Paenibacillus sp. BIHB 4019]